MSSSEEIYVTEKMFSLSDEDDGLAASNPYIRSGASSSLDFLPKIHLQPVGMTSDPTLVPCGNWGLGANISHSGYYCLCL